MEKRGLLSQRNKNILYAALGGILEFYDFVLFAFFLDVFAKVFFPAQDAFWQGINSYVAFGAAYLARPFGSIVMAHFGDRYGRKNIFYLTILLMVIPSFVMVILPGYESIGVWAILLLFLVRICNGLAVGTEVSGAWVYVSEFVRGREIPLALGFISATLTVGLLFGSLATLWVRSFFTEEELLAYAWRLPFLIGGFFGIFALFLRSKLSETPEFQKMQEQKRILSFPLKTALLTHKKAMIVCFLMTIVLTSGTSTLMFLPAYFPQLLGVDKISALWIQHFAILMVIIGAMVQGWLASRFGSYKICVIFSLSFAIFAALSSLYNAYFIPYFMLACFSQGIITFAPVFMVQIFKSELKFSGLSFAYNISYALLGFLTPFIVRATYELYLGFYFVFVGFASLLCVCVLKKFFEKSRELSVIF